MAPVLIFFPLFFIFFFSFAPPCHFHLRNSGDVRRISFESLGAFNRGNSKLSERTRSVLASRRRNAGTITGESDDDCKRATLQSGPMYTISRRRPRCDNRGGAAVPRLLMRDGRSSRLFPAPVSVGGAAAERSAGSPLKNGGEAPAGRHCSLKRVNVPADERGMRLYSCQTVSLHSQENAHGRCNFKDTCEKGGERKKGQGGKVFSASRNATAPIGIQCGEGRRSLGQGRAEERARKSVVSS